MKFSIIIPAYNADKTLNRCFDSILAQTFKDFEVIVVNDGSKDKTKQIIDHYADTDSRISAIHKPNGGVSSARNEGLSYASGEYIVFIDADDYIDKDYLESFSKSNADIIVCGFKMFGNSSNKSIPSPQFITGHENICNHLCDNISKSYFRTPWSKAFKSSIIKRNNCKFDTAIRFGEDSDFNFRVFANADSIEIISTAAYNYYSENPYNKWTLTPKEYKYSIEKIFNSIDNMHCSHAEKAKKDMQLCYYLFFASGLWNTSLRQSFVMTWDYLFKRLVRYMPYRKSTKLKKFICIMITPYLKLIKSIL